MNRTSEGHFTEAQNDLRQLLALPAGGVHRDDAQSYLDKVIPQRIQQNGLRAQASQALKASDFQAARQAAEGHPQRRVSGFPSLSPFPPEIPPHRTCP